MASCVTGVARTAEQELIESLQTQLDIERKHNKIITEQSREMKRQMGLHQSQIEAEEEAMTNKLMTRITEIEKEKQSLATKVEWEERRLNQEKQDLTTKLQANSSHLQRLKEEKEKLTHQVEQEEHMTSVYQDKLSKLLAEKVQLEKRLEQEQAYNDNRLQKQLAETQKEKHQLETLLEEERGKVAAMEEQKRQATEKLHALRELSEREGEYITNKLSKTTQGLLHEKADLLRRFQIEQQNVAALSKECETQRQELRKFQGASYVMQQRIIKESQRLRKMTHTNAMLAETFEMELERQLNSICKQQNGVAIDQPPPRPHYSMDSHDSSLPLPDNDGSEDGSEGGDDVVGELEALTGFNPRRHYGETRSLPAFSPRQSPWQTPSATPFGSRSHSPINASPSSSRSLSPAQSTLSQSSMSSADTTLASRTETFGGRAFKPTGSTGSASSPSARMGSSAPIRSSKC